MPTDNRCERLDHGAVDDYGEYYVPLWQATVVIIGAGVVGLLSGYMMWGI